MHTLIAHPFTAIDSNPTTVEASPTATTAEVTTDDVTTSSISTIETTESTQQSFVNMLFDDDQTPWYLKYATKSPSTASKHDDHIDRTLSLLYDPLFEASEESAPTTDPGETVWLKQEVDDDHPLLINDFIGHRPHRQKPRTSTEAVAPYSMPSNQKRESRSSLSSVDLSVPEIGAL